MAKKKTKPKLKAKKAAPKSKVKVKARPKPKPRPKVKAEPKAKAKAKAKAAPSTTIWGESGLFQPDLDLALCIGPEPATIEDLAQQLGSDLEEMRWDYGSGPQRSKLIPFLEALVEEAGDPYEVAQDKLEALVREHAAPIGSAKAEAFQEACENDPGD